MSVTPNNADGGRSANVMPEILARIRRLEHELSVVNQACDAARLHRQAGQLFYLLRKKWKLTQAIFEAESAIQLLSEKSDRRAG